MCKISYLLFLFLFLIVHFSPVYSQNIFSNELETLKFDSVKVKKNKKTGILLRTYSIYFSSQDGNSCTFYPTCSGYAVSAVKKKGLLMGIFAAADRLLRCNPYNKEWYLWDASHHTYSDHVD